MKHSLCSKRKRPRGKNKRSGYKGKHINLIKVSLETGTAKMTQERVKLIHNLGNAEEIDQMEA